MHAALHLVGLAVLWWLLLRVMAWRAGGPGRGGASGVAWPVDVALLLGGLGGLAGSYVVSSFSL